MTARVLSRLTGILLVSLFVGMGLVASRQQFADRSMDERLEQGIEVNRIYDEVRIAALRAEAAAHRLWLSDDARGDLAAYVEASRDVSIGLQRLAIVGAPEDRAFVMAVARFGAGTEAALATLQGDLGRLLDSTGAATMTEALARAEPAALQELAETQRALDGASAEIVNAVLTGEFALPADVTIGPGLAEWKPGRNMFPDLIAAQADYQAAALARVQERHHTSVQQAFGITTSLYAAGITLLLALLYLMAVFSRREARAKVELGELRAVANADVLTGLGNRRCFEEEAPLMLNRAAHTGQRLALVMVDLDQFKEVNDTWGHDRGDEVLRQFAAMLTALAPEGSGVYRIGGDEFALILPCGGEAAAFHVVEQVRDRAERELPEGVTMSGGLAMLERRGGGDATLLKQQADAALYEAKLRGRNLVVAYDSGQSAPVFPAAKLQAVRQLLVEGDLDVHFQPIWDLTSQTVLAYEALARPHAKYELSGPEQAFDIAERFGRAADLDRICWQRALVRAKHLPAEALLFINLSPYTVTHHSFSAAGLVDELLAAGLSPARVVFEVTERSQVPVDVVAHGVEELHRLGCSVALDDVGAGNSGLEMLRKVQFEYVKVDRSVVVSACRTGTGRAALMAILAFAAESRASVVAEGIEDEEMLLMVREVARGSRNPENGLIHGVQGFLLGRPAPGFVQGDEVPRALAA